MPVFFRYSGYRVFFWVHENNEPIHFHIAEGTPSENSTKVWILQDGSFLMAHNNSRIPAQVLRRVYAVMQDNLEDYIRQWKLIHGEVTYYQKKE